MSAGDRPQPPQPSRPLSTRRRRQPLAPIDHGHKMAIRKRTAAGQPVLGSLMQQFDKLRQQRSVGRHNNSNHGRRPMTTSQNSEWFQFRRALRRDGRGGHCSCRVFLRTCGGIMPDCWAAERSAVRFFRCFGERASRRRYAACQRARAEIHALGPTSHGTRRAGQPAARRWLAEPQFAGLPDSPDALVDEMLASGRYALLLRPEMSQHLERWTHRASGAATG